MRRGKVWLKSEIPDSVTMGLGAEPNTILSGCAAPSVPGVG